MTDHTAEPAPYQEITDDQFADWVAAHFTVEEPRLGTMVLRGPCPRCNAIIDVPIVRHVARTVQAGPLFGRVTRRLGAEPERGAAAEHVEPMLCTCDEEHPNRPAAAYGCGAYWTLILSKEDA